MEPTEKLKAMFEAVADDFLKFERIEQPASPRRDLCGFLLLASLVPGSEPMISASAHDEYFLSIDVEQLAAVATEADVLTLTRCGIRYDASNDCLAVYS
jgi:hypothetical protein